jgi:transposase
MIRLMGSRVKLLHVDHDLDLTTSELWAAEMKRDVWNSCVTWLSRKSKLAEAIRYALTRRASLERFLSDGRIELDSNTVEHAIRPQTITRKNSLFAGSDGGSRTWAAIASLLATVKMNNVDPHAWLTQALERIANGWPSREIKALMPWNYRPWTASASRLRFMSRSLREPP